jgi:glycine dehydrogenase subunit 2
MGYSIPPLDVPEVDPSELLGTAHIRDEKGIEGFPEVSEPEVVRHFVRLSQLNHSIDTGFYPLGSCTMKYNPKINEVLSSLTGFAQAHPLQPGNSSQGCLELMASLEDALAKISGMDAVTLQPAAGAQGEFTSLLMIRKALEVREGSNCKRTKILVPDSAHGTNPASCTLCGFDVVELRSNAKGLVDMKHLKEIMSDEVAGLMLTNPNTLGFFEEDIAEICSLIHQRGGYVYCDGANLNAIMGIVRPGDLGFDVMHINLHKTFTTPHGGGGPGSGPVAVKEELAAYLPNPRIVRRESRYYLENTAKRSIGRIAPFMGNFGMFVRALCYILEMGASGLKKVSELAVLNANYLKKNLRDTFDLPYDAPAMHEVVFSDKKQKEFDVSTMDMAKRLMDYGIHPPTVYFPLIVKGALMIEPTETENKEALDQFIRAMKEIAVEAKENPEALKTAPHTTKFKRMDEARAARNPILRWQK